MTTMHDRRPPESMLAYNRRSDIIDHMASYHTDQPDLSGLVNDIRQAHRDSHSSGTVLKPHRHDLPTNEVG